MWNLGCHGNQLAAQRDMAASCTFVTNPNSLSGLGSERTPLKQAQNTISQLKGPYLGGKNPVQPGSRATASGLVFIGCLRDICRHSDLLYNSYG